MLHLHYLAQNSSFFKEKTNFKIICFFSFCFTSFFFTYVLINLQNPVLKELRSALLSRLPMPFQIGALNVIFLIVT